MKLRLHRKALENFPYWLAGLLTGLLATGYAVAFKILAQYSLGLFHAHFLLWASLVPLGFFLSWYSVRTFAPEASGSGIPQVMAAIQKGHPEHAAWYLKLLGMKVVVVKVASSLFAVAVGGAIGREGPTIQIGASVFNWIFPYTATHPKDEAKKRKALILAGGAAGIAAAFNTPLGGIVFAIEELATDSFKEFRSTVLLAVIVAGMTAQWFTGTYLYLGHPAVEQVHALALAYSLVLAVAGGALGAIFGSTLFRLVTLRRKAVALQTHFFWIAGLSIAFVTLAYFSEGYAIGPGSEGIKTLLENHPHTSAWHVFTRFAANQITYLTGGAGGIFSPALSIGANLGSATGSLLSAGGTETNLLVVVGMVSFLTGITHAPFTSLVLVIEMIDQPTLTVPVMLSALIADFAAKTIQSHSFYEQMSELYVPH